MPSMAAFQIFAFVWLHVVSCTTVPSVDCVFETSRHLLAKPMIVPVPVAEFSAEDAALVLVPATLGTATLGKRCRRG